jgi:phage-related minor tail protein
MAASKEVGTLRTKLSWEDDGSTKSLKSLRSDLKGLSTELNVAKSKGKEYAGSMQGLKEQSDILTRRLNTQSHEVSELKKRYDEAKRVKGEDAQQTKNLANQYNNAVARMNRTEAQLKTLNSQIDDQAGRWKNLGNRINDFGDSVINNGRTTREIGRGLTTSLTLPIAGVGTAAIRSALEVDTAQGSIQAQLGETGRRSEELAEISKDLWQDAITNSVAGATTAITTADRLLKGLSNEQLENIAISALDLEKTFGYGVQESLRSAKALVDNFGIDGQKAFDYITRAAQETGDYSQDLLDTINEYSPQFKAAGLSVDGMFNILVQGAQNGAFNMDKVGDAVKEFNIRAKDGSKSTADGFKAIGLNAEDMGEAIAKGGEDGERAFMATVAALAAVEDPVARNIAGVALFGTQFEDLESKVITSLDPTKDMLGDVEGATKKAGDAIRDNFGTRATRIWRDFQEELLPVGEKLLDIGEDVLPEVVDMVGSLTDSFSDLSPEMQTSVIAVAGLTAAAGPLLVGIGGIVQGVGGAVSIFGSLTKTIGGKGGVAGTLLGLVGKAGPIGLGISAAGLLGGAVLGIVDAFRDKKKAMEDVQEVSKEDIDKTNQLADSYDKLLLKNQLSNEEMVRYLDIQALLQQTTSEEKIAALKDEQEKLREKSGLTNDEMDKFLDLNQQVIEKAPETEKSMGKYGAAYAANTDALRAMNDEQLKAFNFQIQEEAIEAVSQIAAKNKEIADAKARQVEIDSQLPDIQQSIYDKGDQIKAKEEEIKSLKNDHTANGQRLVFLAEEELTKLEQQKESLINKQSELRNEYNQKQKNVDKDNEAIGKLQEQIDKTEALILEQVGLTSEKGNGITKIRETISNLEAEKGKLRELKAAGELNTAEYDQQVGSIDTQISRLNSAKGKLDEINETAGKRVYKDIELRETPTASDFDATLRSKLGAPIQKYIELYSDEPRYAKGTDNHPGGVFMAGEEGYELAKWPNGKMSILNEGYYSGPPGTQIFPHAETKRMLKKWKEIPKLARGGTVTDQGIDVGRWNPMNIAAGNNRETESLLKKQNAILTALLNKETNLNIDGYTFARVLSPHLEQQRGQRLDDAGIYYGR